MNASQPFRHDIVAYLKEIYVDLANGRRNKRPTLREIGEFFSLTRERIRQYLTYAFTADEQKRWYSHPADRKKHQWPASRTSAKAKYDEVMIDKILKIVEEELAAYDQTGEIKFASNGELADRLGVHPTRIDTLISKNVDTNTILQRRRKLRRCSWRIKDQVSRFKLIRSMQELIQQYESGEIEKLPTITGICKDHGVSGQLPYSISISGNKILAAVVLKYQACRKQQRQSKKA
jgi:hypothetical protein